MKLTVNLAIKVRRERDRGMDLRFKLANFDLTMYKGSTMGGSSRQRARQLGDTSLSAQHHGVGDREELTSKSLHRATKEGEERPSSMAGCSVVGLQRELSRSPT
eukprot:CAMPEP_0174912430 /NCGR_PEP_ID=MMETSP0167-20121228/79782_1 /TAXON_ID=38298 /ORGANISM="Rhodella maculata, Strain CCMP736" /LENGTH=103 /DNA_ID=CAMNT_0016157079 /DNA_START=490 /DNA_END=799 /DNA_ORIENTATION=+